MGILMTVTFFYGISLLSLSENFFMLLQVIAWRSYLLHKSYRHLQQRGTLLPQIFECFFLLSAGERGTPPGRDLSRRPSHANESNGAALNCFCCCSAEAEAHARKQAVTLSGGRERSGCRVVPVYGCAALSYYMDMMSMNRRIGRKV